MPDFIKEFAANEKNCCSTPKQDAGTSSDNVLSDRLAMVPHIRSSHRILSGSCGESVIDRNYRRFGLRWVDANPHFLPDLALCDVVFCGTPQHEGFAVYSSVVSPLASVRIAQFCIRSSIDEPWAGNA